MINNPLRPGDVRLLLVISALYGCTAARANEPAPLQGVVEHDDRVLGFELSGRILALPVQRGQSIEADGLLAQLDPALATPARELRAAELAGAQAQLRLLRAGARAEELRAAEADIEAARSQESMLRTNLDRQRVLVDHSALAQSVVDDTTAQLRAATERRTALEERTQALRKGARGDEIAAAVARVTAAQAGLASEEARLSRFDLHSPAAGDVVDVHVEVGEIVLPGAPVITLADLSHPFVDVFVPQARAASVHVGQAMQVRVDGVTEPLRGRVEHIFPKTEFTPHYLFSEDERPNLVVRARVRVEDPERILHAGLPAFATPSTAP
jgi:HlyD family secretion protein